MKTLGIIILAFLLTAPFALVTPLLPFIILIFLYFICRFSLVGFLKGERPINRGFAVTAVLLFPVAFAIPVLDGGIFTPGPFYGTNFNGDIETLTMSNKVSYGSGELISYASDDTHAPILAYFVDEKPRWATELKPSSDFPLEVTEIVDMQVSYGIVRNRVDFFAKGSNEPGWAFLWKFGGVQKFYLKVF